MMVVINKVLGNPWDMDYSKEIPRESKVPQL
jgi:hypothetical protein